MKNPMKKFDEVKRTSIILDHKERAVMRAMAAALRLDVNTLLTLIIHDHVATRQSYIESDMPSGNHA